MAKAPAIDSVGHGPTYPNFADSPLILAEAKKFSFANQGPVCG
jgi:hypothetical protein